LPCSREIKPAEIVLVGDDQIVPTLEYRRALLGRHRAPRGQRSVRGVESRARIGRTAVGNAGEHRVGRWIG
jgi:hypothetical protein